VAGVSQKMVVSPSDESEREVQQAKLNAAIAQGIADLEAGRFRPAEEVFDELKARYEAMIEQRRT
jgi:antitoxin ParD1/3/4